MDKQAIQDAIKVIIREGFTVYVDPSLASEAQAFGLAVSSVIANPDFLIEASAADCENWNHHDVAKTLRALL
jgi:hypothetical protein